MARLTEAHKLYFYQLFSKTLGFNRQTSLPEATQVLADDGLAPLDVGLESEQEFFAALSDFVKITTFKKGRMYVTVLPHQGFDQALAKLGTVSAADKAAAQGKPWKRKKGAKSLKPQKPRHIEPVAQTEIANPEPETPETQAPEANTLEAQAHEAGVSEPEEHNTPTPEPATNTSEPSTPELSELEEDTLEINSIHQSPEAPSNPQSTPAEKSESLPAATTTEDQQPISEEPEPDKVLRESEVPHITLNITYIPEDDELIDSQSESQKFEPAASTSVTPEVAQTASQSNEMPFTLESHRSTYDKPADTSKSQTLEIFPVIKAQLPKVELQADLPASIKQEVYLADDFLGSLYQMMPLETPMVDLVESDWQVARSTGELAGTRSHVSFALSARDPQTGARLVATLRHVPKLPSGKRWILDTFAPQAALAAAQGSHELMSFDNTLEHAHQAWLELAASPNTYQLLTPLRAFIQNVELGNLQDLAATLHTLAPSAPCPPKLNAQAAALNCLASRLFRAHEQNLYAQDALTHITKLNSGLLSRVGTPLLAELTPHAQGAQVWTLVSITGTPAAQSEPAPQTEPTAQPKPTAQPDLPQAPQFVENPAALMAPVARSSSELALRTALGSAELSRPLAKLFAGSLGPNQAIAELIALIAPTEKNMNPEVFRNNAELWDALCAQVSEAAQLALTSWQLDWTQAAHSWDCNTGAHICLLPLKLGSTKPTFALALEYVPENEQDQQQAALIVRTILTAQSAYLVTSPISSAAQLFA